MLRVGETRNTTKTRAVSYRCWERACVRQEKGSARASALAGRREGGRPASATHSFMTSISRRLLGEHMVSSRFRFRFSSRFACFVGRGPSRRADGNLGGHGPPQRPKNGRAELPGSRSLGPAGRSRGYVYPAGPRASLCCCLVSVKEDLVFFFFGGGGGANCIYCAKIRKNQVTLAEWSKAVRSGRIHLLMAWVRIPQVTT